MTNIFNYSQLQDSPQVFLERDDIINIRKYILTNNKGTEQVYTNIDDKDFKKMMKSVTKYSSNGKGLLKFVLAGEIMARNPDLFSDELIQELIKRLDSDVRVHTISAS
jgi:hypothetical protein